MGLFGKMASGAKHAAAQEASGFDPLGKKRIAELEQKLADAESVMTTEMRDAMAAKEEVRRLNAEVESRQSALLKLKKDIIECDTAIMAKREQIVTFDDALLVQSFGIYEPRYEAATSSQYKDTIKDVREKQKALVKGGGACYGNNNWQVNGSLSQGKKMVKDVQKLLLRSFNVECDETVSKVKYNNFQASEKRIRKAAESISRLGKTWSIAITPKYIDLKIDELHLAFQYAQAKEKEKEELRELREQEREEAKLRKEIEAERKRLEKERTQYEKELSNVIKQLSSADGDEKQALEEKKAKIEETLSEVAKGIEDVDYREANKRAGFVYVISNVGSFGDGVYKIGMTRRLDPMDRVRELSDASVPFNFDVHAMIFTDDAPGLEAALHKEFESSKINLVNQRREFFKCSLDSIKEAVTKNYDRTVEFADTPDAEQFRISEKMRAEGITALPQQLNAKAI